MNSPPSTSRDCRPYCSPPQTVKKLLEEKRQRKTSQVSAPLVEFAQDIGAPFVPHSPSQQLDDTLVYSRSAPHYSYAPLEDFYVPGAGAPYCQLERYESGGPETSNLDTEVGVVSMPPESYLPPFIHGPPWQDQMSSSYSPPESFMIMSGSLVPDINQMELEKARAEIRNLSSDQLLHRDEDGDTILHLYAARGLRALSYAVAEQLFGQLDAKEHNGKSPLLVAVAANQPEIVYDLITLGADLNASDWKGQTALHVAGTYGFSNVLRVFGSLQHQYNTNVEARNYDGLTPLHCAVITQNCAYKNSRTLTTPDTQERDRETLACVQLLLHLGASCDSQDIKSNKTVLHLAVQAGNLPLVKYLLSLPHVDLPGLINMKAHGNTALHNGGALPPHQSTYYLIQLLLFSGGDPNRNLENEQAAHLVPQGKYSEQIKLLLKRRSVMSSSRHQSASSL
ncbi:LOW QUALITY PROTEIN: NF-kappa-B inhibitor delta [Discoglossus pictus]